jgi:FHA domain
MPTCPAGHESASSDFCDNCGMRIGAATPAPPVPSGPAPVSSAPAAPSRPAAPGAPCPQCGTPQAGQFCEKCGFNFASGQSLSTAVPVAGPPPPPPPTNGPASGPPASGVTGSGPAGSVDLRSGGYGASGPAAGPAWTAVVTADRGYFDAVVAAGGPDAATMEFPGYCPERRFRLAGPEMRIGRRSVSRGLQPEIDLTGPPADTGVSHLHAVLLAQPDGSWAIVDPGSANGTKLNDQDLGIGVQTPLHDGDRICLGAWTRLTISSE